MDKLLAKKEELKKQNAEFDELISRYEECISRNEAKIELIDELIGEDEAEDETEQVPSEPTYL